MSWLTIEYNTLIAMSFILELPARILIKVTSTDVFTLTNELIDSSYAVCQARKTMRSSRPRFEVKDSWL